MKKLKGLVSIKRKTIFIITLSFLLILSTGCSRKKIINEINVGHNGRSTDEVKAFMIVILLLMLFLTLKILKWIFHLE